MCRIAFYAGFWEAKEFRVFRQSRYATPDCRVHLLKSSAKQAIRKKPCLKNYIKYRINLSIVVYLLRKRKILEHPCMTVFHKKKNMSNVNFFTLLCLLASMKDISSLL